MKSGISGGQAKYNPAPPGRLHLYGIDERSSGADPVLADIFKTMRASLGMPPADVARLLHMPLDVLANLETGKVRALPPFPETVRYIADYGRLLDIDVKPILARIKSQTGDREPPLVAAQRESSAGRFGAALQAMKRPSWMTLQADAGDNGTRSRFANAAAAAPPAAMTVAHPAKAPRLPAKAAALDASTMKSTRYRRSVRRGGMTVAVAVALSAGIWSAAQSQSTVLFAAVDQLPSGLARSIRHGIDRMAMRMVRMDDGLTWVVVNDPRSRKGDKLPIGKSGG